MVALQSGDTTRYQVVNANACTASCQTTYNNSEYICITTYDPSTCGSDIQCQINLTTQQAACIQTAVDALNSCDAACPATQCTGKFVRQ